MRLPKAACRVCGLIRRLTLPSKNPAAISVAAAQTVSVAKSRPPESLPGAAAVAAAASRRLYPPPCKMKVNYVVGQLAGGVKHLFSALSPRCLAVEMSGW